MRDAGVPDLCADLLHVLALWVLGAHAWLCVLAGALTMLHEAGRASASAAGMRGVGVITVWERPSRLIVAGLTLLATGLAPTVAGPVATAGAAVASGLATVGLGQLLAVIRRRLG